MKDWAEIFIIRGDFLDEENLGFQMALAEIRPSAGDAPTERQLAALKRFYGRDFSDLSSEQAHEFLAARDFGEATARAYLTRNTFYLAPLLATCIAAFITHDKELSNFVAKWSERAWKSGSSLPRVKSTPIFNDVCAFADYVIDRISDAGWIGQEFSINSADS